MCTFIEHTYNHKKLVAIDDRLTLTINHTGNTLYDRSEEQQSSKRLLAVAGHSDEIQSEWFRRPPGTVPHNMC